MYPLICDQFCRGNRKGKRLIVLHYVKLLLAGICSICKITNHVVVAEIVRPRPLHVLQLLLYVNVHHYAGSIFLSFKLPAQKLSTYLDFEYTF